MSKFSIEKGKCFERWCANKFAEIYPKAKRGFQYRGGGKEAEDVINTPFHIEAKHWKQPNVRAALRQAVRDAKEGKIPLAIIKDDYKKPFCGIFLDDMLEILDELETLRRIADAK